MKKMMVAVMVAVCALGAGLASAQDNVSFVDAQLCVVDSNTTESYYVLAYNYAQDTLAWTSEMTTASTIPYTLPANEWVGLFLYKTAPGAYDSVEYTYRYAGAGFRSQAVAPEVTLAASPSSSLAFSASSSLVVADVNTPNSWLYWFNYNTLQQEWTLLSQDTVPVAATAPLGQAQEWIGMFLYDQDAGTWEEETFYTMWDSLGD